MSYLARVYARTFFVILLAFCTLVAEAATPEVERGLTWLSGQLQADGSLPLSPQAKATPLQNQSEVAHTLRLLSVTPASLIDLIAADSEDNTEFLARRIGTLAADGKNVSALVATLASRQNADGGFGGAEGYASNALDTAWALIGLNSAPFGATAASALNYLKSAQQTDGAFKALDRSDLYTSATVLNALRLYAAGVPLTPTINLTSNYLMAQQEAPGNWGSKAWLSALVYQAVHAFVPAEPTANAFSAFLISRQSADGSWDGDLYSTAVILRALTLAGQVPGNPTVGIIQGKLIDSQTWLPVMGATVSLSGTSAAVVTTAGDGTFTFAAVPPGTYNLAATLPNYGIVSTTTTIKANQTIDFGDLRVTKTSGAATGTVYGTVTDAATGAKLDGATVTVGAASVITSPNGLYQFLNIAPGDIAVTVAKPGYVAASTVGRLASSGTLLYSPALSVDGKAGVATTITGVVMDASTNEVLPGVSVSVTDGARTYRLTSAADGRFSAAGLVKDVNGAVTLNFAKPEYRGLNISAQMLGVPVLDIGQVRLRNDTASVLLPDLKIIKVDRTDAISDPQSLSLSGTMGVTLQNVGAAVAGKGFTLSAFADLNRDGKFDPAIDTALGAVDAGTDVTVNQLIHYTIPVTGKLLFRDAPIHVWADSAQIQVETNENNNIGTSATAAEVRPDPKAFRPVLKWKWLEGNVVSTPLVGPLTDSNGDGKFNAHDVPTVVTVLGLGIDFQPGLLTALSGKDGSKLWQNTTDQVLATGQLAFGDLDGTGRLQIAAYMAKGGLGIFESDGRLRCKQPEPGFAVSYNYGGPTIADLDGDGKAEVILHNYVLNSDCSIRHVLGTKAMEEATWASVVADLDLDGKPEIITGRGVYRWDGSLYWGGSTFGRLGVARLDPNDPHPQIISVNLGTLTVYRHDGRIMWGPVHVAARNGGAPTIADFTGDGKIGIGVAGEWAYAMYNADGSVRWSKPVSDGSGATGSTAFDFDGSGNSKIVYADQDTLFVYNGKDGAIEFSTPNSSATAGEYPVVADVDGDGHADMLVGSNGGSANGLYVYQDVNNAWVNTRKIWNQYAYHITNINDDGSVPRVEQNSWDVHNTYRLNARPGVSATAVADVTASFVRVNDKGGTAASTFTVRIGNASSLELEAGTRIALYNGAAGTTLLNKAATSRVLAGGEYEDVVFSYASSLSGITHITIVADDDGNGKATLIDFDRKNNTVSLPLASLPTMPGLSVQTDQFLYGAAQDVQITATIANGTSFDTTARVRFQIMTAGGQLVATLPLTGMQVASSGQAVAISTWNTGATLAAGYQVKAQLVDSAGLPVGEASTPFALQAGKLALAAALATDKQVYLPAATVRLSARATNLNPNALLDNLTVATSVTNPDGTLRFERSEPLAQLGQAASRDYAYSLALGMGPVGVYQARFDVKDSGGVLLGSAQAKFSVASSTDSGAGLTGTIAASPQPVPQGDSLAVTFSVNNQGNSALRELPLTVRIIDPQAGTEQMKYELAQPLEQGGTYHGAVNWTADGVVGKTYMALLQAQLGSKSITLAQTNVKLSARAAIPVDLDIKQGIAGGSRVLVLVSCGAEDDEPAPAGKVAPCTTWRTAAIHQMLTALRVTYTIATDEVAFKYALRSGAYNTYWISGKQDKLHDDLAGEVREAVFGGDGLILDGVHDERNKVLDAVPSIIYRGKLGERDLPVAIGGPDFTAQRLGISGQGLKILLDGGTQQAAFDGSRPNTDGPAMVSYAYGQGRGVMFAFDLVASYKAEPQWLPVLGTALTLATPGQRSVLAPGALMQIHTRIANRASAVDLQVRSTLGAGALVNVTEPAATLDGNANTVSWAFGLPESATQDLYLTLRAPLVSGDSTIDTIVSSVRDGKVTPYGEPLVQAVKVLGAAQRTTAVLDALRAFPLSGKSGKARDAVATLVQRAQSAAAKNTAAWYQQAISDLVDAGGQLSVLSGVDTRAVHVNITQLLKEAEWRWTLAAPAQ